MPSRVSSVHITGWALLLVWLTLLPARAQQFSYDADDFKPVQSLSVAYTSVVFKFRGDGNPDVRYDYSNPAYGLVYSRPNVNIAVLYGQGSGGRDEQVDATLVDASLSTWGEFRLLGREESGRHQLYLPVLLHSQYRRVSVKGFTDSDIQAADDGFAVTVLGLGTGLGYSGTLGGKVSLQLRTTPIIALATRSFGDATGSSRLLESTADLHLGSIAGRMGLSVGYTFKTQSWNVNASDLFEDVSDDYFDYSGHQHTFRVGLNW